MLVVQMNSDRNSEKPEEKKIELHRVHMRHNKNEIQHIKDFIP